MTVKDAIERNGGTVLLDNEALKQGRGKAGFTLPASLPSPSPSSSHSSGSVSLSSNSRSKLRTSNGTGSGGKGRAGSAQSREAADRVDIEQEVMSVDLSAGTASALPVRDTVILVSHPMSFRRVSYLLALATGICSVHQDWILQSAAAQQLLPVEHFLLPSGASAFHPYYTFRTAVVGLSQEGGGVLHGTRILNLAGASWGEILEAAGASLVPVEQQARVFDGMRSGRMAVNGRYVSVDFVLVDSLAYSEKAFLSRSHKPKVSTILPKSSLGSSGPKVGSAAKSRGGALPPSLPPPPNPAYSLSDEAFSAIEAASFTQDEDGNAAQVCWSGSPRVVSVDWVVHCLGLGEIVDPSTNAMFTLPIDPVSDRSFYF